MYGKGREGKGTVGEWRLGVNNHHPEVLTAQSRPARLSVIWTAAVGGWGVG